MSVVSNAYFAKIDPIIGQDSMVRFGGSNNVTGDASGGYANVNIIIPAVGFQKPFYIIKDIFTYSDNSGAGDCTIMIQHIEPMYGGLVQKCYNIDMVGSSIVTGYGMLMRYESLPRGLINFPYRYNSNISAGVYPQVSVYYTNTNTYSYILQCDGWMVDEKYLPKIMPMISM